MIEAVLFDLDGTLVNTEELKRKAYERTMRSQGVIKLLGLEEYAIVMGRPYNEVAKEFVEQAGIGLSLQDFRHIWNGHYEQLVNEFAAAHNGVPRLFKLIRERRIRIAIVSSSTRIEMERVLKKTGLSQWAENVISADDVMEEKPSPEPYVKAMKLTFCNRDTAIAVEDTDAGCESALAADLSVITVRHELNTRHAFKDTRRILTINEIANPEQFLNRLLEP
jgi:HAD superfamily hydrolase (TIGR01509 family)